MHAVCLVGSARRKGNTAAMASRFCDGLTAGGATVSVHRLGEMRYSGCIGCFGCKTNADHCVLKDDLAPVLEEVRAADVLVMATPVYFGEVSSQLKAFIDRSFSFLQPNYSKLMKKGRLAPGKTLVMLIAQGHPKADLFTDIYPRYEYFFTRYIGYSRSHMLRALGVYYPGDAEGREDVMAEADALASRVLAGE
ncbi:flavodoxin family protein [Desulfocurvibacter africanus]|uniref:flavodoxin family protein n=1 Tax=Desulfocurvibacter africanus TaxID=873 RepID=UPI00047F6EEC|nr:flavodoxin family protein [Desulfocurvibacter africanus]